MFTLQTVVAIEDVTAQLWFAPVLPWGVSTPVSK